MVRGKRPADDPLPNGERQDTRKHTRHPLRPDADAVAAFLSEPTEAAWRAFRDNYLAVVEARYEADPALFDSLAQRAREIDVWLGCSCPSKANPDVQRCHTVLALRFMAERYPDLDVRMP